MSGFNPYPSDIHAKDVEDVPDAHSRCDARIGFENFRLCREPATAWFDGTAWGGPEVMPRCAYHAQLLNPESRLSDGEMAVILVMDS